jgi:hypothetical protein
MQKKLELVLIYSDLEDHLFSDECDSDFVVGEVESGADMSSENSSIYFLPPKCT